MTYRKADYCARKLRTMRDRKLELMIEHAEKYPEERRVILPDIRRQVFILDYDFGFVPYQFNLCKSDRIDCYNVTDGETEVFHRIGWNRFLDELGKAFPRVSGQ